MLEKHDGLLASLDIIKV